MAKKAIYTKIGKRYYRVNQDCSNPTSIFKISGTHSQMSLTPSIKQVDSNIWINPISLDTIKTNMEEYNEMLDYLVDNKITEIPSIQNRYLLYMDYSIFNERGTEVNHNVVTKEIEAADVFYPLGVSMDSELIYKQVKSLNTELSFITKCCTPMGIMRDTSNDMYTLKINDIIIYQDLVYSSSYGDKHYSASENCYACGSRTINSQIQNMKKIFSTYDNGLIIAAVEVPYIPRKMVINLHMAIDNTIVAYDDSSITNILVENLYLKKYEEEMQGKIPEGEKYPTSDGSTTEVNGKYDYYSRVDSDSVGALLVVADDVTGSDYDTETMIHKSMVINDIPDIEVDEYVKYFNVSVMSQCVRLYGGSATD